jgi:hypothetical protein
MDYVIDFRILRFIIEKLKFIIQENFGKFCDCVLQCFLMLRLGLVFVI